MEKCLKFNILIYILILKVLKCYNLIGNTPVYVIVLILEHSEVRGDSLVNDHLRIHESSAKLRKNYKIVNYS